MPTQKELAKRAGVSAGTVSNVISGSVAVSETMRRKVLKAIQELNYQPNLIARSLKTNRTQTLAIVVPDVTIPFFPKVIRGSESAARECGYFVIVVDSDGNPAREREVMMLLRSQRVDGILLVVAGGEKRRPQDAEIIHSGPPVVCVDRLPDGLEVDSVSVDDGKATEMGVSHLLKMGHRQIAILTGPLTLKNERARLRGYRQALRDAGVPVKESLIWPGTFEQGEIEQICAKFLSPGRPRPSALFSTNGVTGLIALRSMMSLGITTPRDMAFVTFDELTPDSLFSPGITSVVQPAFDIGYRAVEILLDRLTPEGAKEPVRKVRLPAKLIIRESSSSPYSKLGR